MFHRSKREEEIRRGLDTQNLVTVWPRHRCWPDLENVLRCKDKVEVVENRMCCLDTHARPGVGLVWVLLYSDVSDARIPIINLCDDFLLPGPTTLCVACLERSRSGSLVRVFNPIP